jgi:hypothetical protein
MKTHITLKNGIMLFCLFFFGLNVILAQEATNKQKQTTTIWSGSSWSNGLPISTKLKLQFLLNCI